MHTNSGREISQPPATGEEVLTPEELAARWKIAKATLADWRVQGGNASPPFFKIGSKHVRYPARLADQWLAEKLRRSTSDPGINAA